MSDCIGRGSFTGVISFKATLSVCPGITSSQLRKKKVALLLDEKDPVWAQSRIGLAHNLQCVMWSPENSLHQTVPRAVQNESSLSDCILVSIMHAYLCISTADVSYLLLLKILTTYIPLMKHQDCSSLPKRLQFNCKQNDFSLYSKADSKLYHLEKHGSDLQALHC